MCSQLSSRQRLEGPGLSSGGSHIQHAEGTPSFLEGLVFQGTPPLQPACLGTRLPWDRDGVSGAPSTEAAPRTVPPFLGSACLLEAYHAAAPGDAPTTTGVSTPEPRELAEAVQEAECSRQWWGGRPVSSVSRPLLCGVRLCLQFTVHPQETGTLPLRGQARETAPTIQALSPGAPLRQLIIYPAPRSSAT